MYLGLVQGVALRHTGDSALAADIAQAVFTKLAARAGRIEPRPTLAPWLHHCAWCESITILRRETARTRYMKAYADHVRTAGAPDSAAGGLSVALPHLDAALQSLPGDDQRIVFLRFYEGLPLREIAAALGKSEAAVRKQGQRALEKMARHLRGRGAGISTATLVAGLGAVLCQPGSAAAASAISAAAVTGGVKLTILNQVLSIMNSKYRTALITAACMALPLIWQWQRVSDLEDQLAGAARENRTLRITNPPLRNQDAQSAARLASTKPVQKNATVSGGTIANWESALKHPDPLQRMSRLAALMNGLTAENAPGVSALFKRLRHENSGNQLYESEQRNFLRAWGRLDGPAAVASLSEGSGGPAASGESLAALAGWAQSDPAAARAWLESQPAGDASTALALGLIDGWALEDFDAAAAYAASLPRSTARDQFRSLLLQRALASGGAPGAQRWFSGIPDDEHNALYKQRAFDELIAALMVRDPSGAAAWISSQSRQPFMNGDAIPELASRLADSSPAEALRWLAALPAAADGVSGASESYARVVNTWAQKDPVAAGAWLQSQSSHPAYDGMASAYAKRLGETDPGAALEWAQSIHDETMRSTARDGAAMALLQRGETEGRVTLAAAGYSETRMDELSKARQARALYSFAIDSFQSEALTPDVTGQQSREDLYFERDAAIRDIETIASRAKLLSDASGVTGESPGFSRAHPGGIAPANCAQCHR